LRSKDRTLRRHLRWFGLSFVGLVVTVLASGFIVTTLGGIVSDATTIPAFTVFAYFIYRSAKSLAPLERMEKPGRRETNSAQPEHVQDRISIDKISKEGRG
jgi:hypothetical protein